MGNFTVRHAQIDPQRITHRLCRNSLYNNNHVGLNNWCLLPLREVRKPKLQEAINEDIKRHGLRNPIIVYALPEGIFLCFGGTRLRACQTLQLPGITCIANDYTGEFRHCPEVTESDVAEYFTDIPPFYEFGEDGFDCHYFLERMRRENATDAGFMWLKNKAVDRSFIDEEMPWCRDLVPTDD